MSNTKYTLIAPTGPYSVSKKQRPMEEGGFAYREIYAANGCPLAQVFGHGEQEYTAKLMAAAPELLQALKDALDMIDKMRFEVSRNMDGMRFTNETVNMTSAALLIGENAIKKATD